MKIINTLVLALYSYKISNMVAFPTINTNRLLLSSLTANDIPAIVKYANNKKIADNTLNIPYPYSEKAAIFWLNLANEGFKNGSNLIFGIKLKQDQEFIGGMGLTIHSAFKRAEIGYWLGEPFWGNGYTTEAAKAVINYAFTQLGLNKITSSHYAKNPNSGRVMVNCGMNKEGVLIEHVLKQNEFQTLEVYGITKSEYFK